MTMLFSLGGGGEYNPLFIDNFFRHSEKKKEQKLSLLYRNNGFGNRVVWNESKRTRKLRQDTNTKGLYSIDFYYFTRRKMSLT